MAYKNGLILLPSERGSMMLRKTVVVLLAGVAFLAFASLASANEQIVKSGGSTVCLNASWIVYNTSESRSTKVDFAIGPLGYSWDKRFSRNLAPGGSQGNALTKKTTFKNNGPGDIVVNCQRQRYDRHDWKIDAGSGKTYQSNYHLDHVQPLRYIEPGLGQPEGTERGVFGVKGFRSESNR